MRDSSIDDAAHKRASDEFRALTPEQQRERMRAAGIVGRGGSERIREYAKQLLRQRARRVEIEQMEKRVLELRAEIEVPPPDPPPLSWRDVFDSTHESWKDFDHAMGSAARCGYPFMAWNGSVYPTGAPSPHPVNQVCPTDDLYGGGTPSAVEERYVQNMAVLASAPRALYDLLGEAEKVIRSLACGWSTELADRIQRVLPRTDAHERAKKAWSDWTAEDIEQEVTSWRNLLK